MTDAPRLVLVRNEGDLFIYEGQVWLSNGGGVPDEVLVGESVVLTEQQSLGAAAYFLTDGKLTGPGFHRWVSEWEPVDD